MEMGSRIKKGATLASFALLLLLAGSLYYAVMTGSGVATSASTDTEGPPDDKIAATADAENAAPSSPHGHSGSLKETFKNIGVSLENQLVRELRKYYGATISQKRTQASMYELRNSIAGCSPDGLRFFRNVLKRAFPEYAGQIMETLDRLDLYHQWLAENAPLLSQMSGNARLAALWEKRLALFGEAAYDMWTDDMMAMDARKQEMRQTLDNLNAAGDMAIEQKLDFYRSKLRDVYKDTPESYLLLSAAA